MAHRISRKQLKQDELVEVASDLGHWVERNRKPLWIVTTAVVLIGVAAAAAWALAERRRERAGVELAAAQRAFEQALAKTPPSDDDLSAALAGFDRVLERSGGGETAAVARYYRAVLLSRLHRRPEAVTALEDLRRTGTPPASLAAAATALLARLYVEERQADRAVELLQAVADGRETGMPPELALLQLGEIQAERGDAAAARQAWQRVLNEHPSSLAAGEARQRLGPAGT